MREHDASVTHLRWFCKPLWARNKKCCWAVSFVLLFVFSQPLGMSRFVDSGWMFDSARESIDGSGGLRSRVCLEPLLCYISVGGGSIAWG